MGMLEGKVALITGAARGIGKAIALKFAEEGADVAFTDLVINEAAEETISEIAAFGHKVKGYASNAANFDETHAVVEEILKEFGHIDILVNNAGITKDGLVLRMSEAQWDAVIAVNLKSAFNFIHAVVEQILADFGRIDILVNNAGITKDGLVLRMTEQQWDAVIAVNLKSAFNFIHAALPAMARQKSGSIINMASIAGQMGNPGQINYASSKAGLIAMAKSVAKEMGSRGIRANAIAPGFIVSDMTNALPEAVRDEYIKNIPLRRGGSVEDIANAALFLASDMASYITGQVIAVNGGLYC